MKVKIPHSWDVDYKGAVAIQEQLKHKLILDDRTPAVIRRVAGADISFSKRDPRVYAAVVVMDAKTLDILEESTCKGIVRFPYIPGLLTFREGPILLKAFEKLTLDPDVILFDGQGIAHPRVMGLAAHMGVILDEPSIGCAKTRLIGEYREPGKKRGRRSPLLHDDREIGTVLRTKDGVKPLFISQGHRVSLDRAVGIVLGCTRKYRIPEPIRRAHILVNEMRREELDKD